MHIFGCICRLRLSLHSCLYNVRTVCWVAVLVDYAYAERLSSLTLFPNTPISIAIYNSAPGSHAHAGSLSDHPQTFSPVPLSPPALHLHLFPIVCHCWKYTYL